MAHINPFEVRRAKALARQYESGRLTTEQKLAKLPATGATRERAKLTARLAAEKAAKKAQPLTTEQKAAKQAAKKAG